MDNNPRVAFLSIQILVLLVLFCLSQATNYYIPANSANLIFAHHQFEDYMQEKSELKSETQIHFTDTRQVEKSVIVWYGSGNYSDVVAHQDVITHCSPYGWYGISGYNVTGNVSASPSQMAHMNSLPSQKFIPIIQDFNDDNVIANLGNQSRRESLADNIYDRVMYDDVDGINIDFEFTAPSSQQQVQLTQFMTYLYNKLHAHGKHLSIDVVAKTTDTSTGFSGAFNYSALANCSDLIIVMTYGYHWSTSPPGPIAPTGWMDKVMRYALDRVPANKLAMGIPLYGRDWYQNETGAWQSNSVWYHSRQALISQYSPTIYWEATHDSYASNEPYFAYTDSLGRARTVYFQNEDSIACKLSVATNRSIPSVAFWQLYDEDQSIWPRVKQWKNPNEPPIANAGSDQTVYVNQPVQFNGSASSDPDGDELTYFWDFGDGNTSTLCAPVHTYTNAGNYLVTLNVSDGEFYDEDTLQVTVNAQLPSENIPPNACAGLGFSVLSLTEANFNASCSEDPDGVIVSYNWDFGDGNYTNLTTPYATHVYSAPKTYTVKLTVMDNNGSSATDTIFVQVLNRRPSASLTYSPSEPRVGLEVSFNASGSKDDDGYIAAYNFDFGDGNTTGWISTYIAQHAYSTAGQYNVKVKVKDNIGNISETSILVNVSEESMLSGYISSNADSVLTNSLITFNAVLNGTIPEEVQYHWKFGDDEEFFTSSPSANHSYFKSGIYTVLLIVSHEGKIIFTTEKIIEVLNRPPEVRTEIVGIEVLVKTSFVLNVTAWDYDGMIVLYEWDYEGDGSYEWNSVTSGNITLGYNEVGCYNCTIRVTDNEGEWAISKVSVIVLDGYPPVVSVTTKLNSTVNGTIIIEGKSQASGIRSIQKVEYKIDNLTWQNADGKENWRFIINTGMLNNGKHVIQIRGFDGKEYSSDIKIEFYVLNKSSKESDERTLFYARLVVIILVGVLCLSIGGIVGRLSRKRASYPIDEGFTREYGEIEHGFTHTEYVSKPEVLPAFDSHKLEDKGYEPLPKSIPKIPEINQDERVYVAKPVLSIPKKVTPISMNVKEKGGEMKGLEKIEKIDGLEKVSSYESKKEVSEDYAKSIKVTKAHEEVIGTYTTSVVVESEKKKEYGSEEKAHDYLPSKEGVQNKLTAVGKLLEGARAHGISMPEAVKMYEDAKLLYEKGELVGAAETAERALETAELLEELYWDAFETLKDAKESAEMLKDPTVCDKLISLAEGLMVNNMYVEAIEYAKKAKKLAEKHAKRGRK